MREHCLVVKLFLQRVKGTVVHASQQNIVKPSCTTLTVIVLFYGSHLCARAVAREYGMARFLFQ